MLYVPTYKLESSTSDKLDFGHELTVNAVLEGVFPASPTVAVALRGFGGPQMLIVGGDLEKKIDSFQCGSGLSCHHGKGPFVGYDYGVGMGLLLGLDSIRLRADLLLQGYKEQIMDEDYTASTGSGSANVSVSTSGTRYWLTLGFEL